MHPRAARLAPAVLAAALATSLAGCGAARRPPFFDVSAPPAEPPASVHLQFTPQPGDPATHTRPGWSSTTYLFISTSQPGPVEVSIQTSEGRVQMDATTDGLRWDGARNALVGRVSSGRVEAVRLRATDVGEPLRPGDVLTVRSPYGTAYVEVWIEPTPGEWRNARPGGAELRLPVVGVHAALMREDEDARVLFFSPPRERHADGTFRRDPRGAAFGGGFEWNVDGLRDVEIAVWDVTPDAILDRPMEEGTPGTDRRNIFCSGHALLPNGQLLVAGGHARFGEHDADFLHVYSASLAGPSWRRASSQRMRFTRWYPTVTTLPDGIMLLSSGRAGAYTAGAGDLFSGWNITRDRYELFDPRADALVPLTDAGNSFIPDAELATYPAVFVLPGGAMYPDGALLAQERNLGHLFSYHPGTARPLRLAGERVFVGGGPSFAEHVYPTASLGSRSFPWYGAAVLLPFAADSARHTRVLVTGGQDERVGNHVHIDPEVPATSTAEVFDFDNTRPLDGQAGWRSVASMVHPRMLHDATLLPDGRVLVTGGARRGWANRNRDSVMEAEMYDPVTERFSEMAPARFARRYHSTALLMPDATVLKAGSTGGFNDAEEIVPQFVAERYFPPYLWRGRRPVILSFEGTANRSVREISYGQRVDVGVRAERLQGLRVGLMRLGSVTHGNNMDQRYVWLSEPTPPSTSGSVYATLFVAAPADGSIAPPGDYMLFVVDALGVPSEARFVRLRMP